MSSHTGELSDRPYWYQLMVLLGIWLAAYIGFSLIGSFLLASVLGLDVFSIGDWESIHDPKIINTFRWMQIILSLGIFVVPAIIFARMRRGSVSKELAFDISPKLITLAITTILVFLSWPVVYILLEFNQAIPFPENIYDVIKRMEDAAQSMLKTLILIQTPYDFVVVVIMVAIVPAVGEELLFRGAMQPLLIKWTNSAVIGILLCGFLFSFMHLQFLGFFPRMALGVLFGFIFYYSGSIWVAIFAHLIHNGAQLAFFHIHEAGLTEIDPEDPQVFPFYISLIALALIIFFMKVLKKGEKKELGKYDLNEREL